jgi:hypothetical protein
MSAHGFKPPGGIAPAGSALPQPNQTNHRMGLPVAADLVVCGVVFPIVTLMAQRLHSDFHGVALVVGFVGGGLCAAWGFMGRRGRRCRLGAIVTLGITACVFAWQAVESWQSLGMGESNGRMVAMLMSVLTVFSLGMVANLVRDGKSPEP